MRNRTAFLATASVIAILVHPAATAVRAASATTPCAPADPKPTKVETRLGSFSVAPDIIAVGQIMAAVVKNAGDVNQISIDVPGGTTVVDYAPKTLAGVQVSAGKWTAGTSPVPAGDYSLTLKPTRWTRGKWSQIGYGITNGQGLGTGFDNYFAYYDKADFKLAIDGRNQVAQTTKQVIRKVTVSGPPDIRTTLSTNKGSLGTTISETQGAQATQTAPGNGQSTFYLTANEGDKVTLTATSADTCSDSTVSQQFTIAHSDVANNYHPPSLWSYWWLWLLLLLLIAGIVVYLLRRSRPSTSPVPPPQSPVAPTITPPSPPTQPTTPPTPPPPSEPPTPPIS